MIFSPLQKSDSRDSTNLQKPSAGKSHSVVYLSHLNPARISPTNSSGCSHAAGYSVNSVSRLPDEDHAWFCLDDRGKTLVKDQMIFDTQRANGINMSHSMAHIVVLVVLWRKVLPSPRSEFQVSLKKLPDCHFNTARNYAGGKTTKS
jgi:hypothetical protein